MKIKMEKGGIVNISLRVKDFHFHRKITPEQNVISNLILAKCKGKQFLYVNSSHNEVLSSELEKGEYVLLYHEAILANVKLTSFDSYIMKRFLTYLILLVILMQKLKNQI